MSIEDQANHVRSVKRSEVV
ncbi:MAG: hypothetical protein U0T36_06240 [Saprospiraceae bacterium]